MLTVATLYCSAVPNTIFWLWSFASNQQRLFEASFFGIYLSIYVADRQSVHLSDGIPTQQMNIWIVNYLGLAL